jgi:hypothetical protein
MDDHHDVLRAAFQAVLDARPEPRLPSVTDAAVAGGRRIRRRRRAALSAAGALAVAACTAVVVLVGQPGTGVEGDPSPAPPAGTVPPTTAVPEEIPQPGEPDSEVPRAEPDPLGR